MPYIASFSLSFSKLKSMSSMLADVELRLEEHAMDRLTPPTVCEIQIVLEAEFRKLRRVEGQVRRQTPAFTHQVSLGQSRQERHSNFGTGAIGIIHPEDGYPTIGKSVKELGVEPEILGTRCRDSVNVIRSCLVIPKQILRLPGKKRKASDMIHRLPFQV